MKKWFVGLAFSIFSAMGVASAQFGYADFRGAAGDIIQWINDIFGPFFAVLLGVSEFDEYLFARVLLVILLFIIIYSVIKRVKVFKDYGAVSVLVAIIVSLLGARTLSESQFIVGILIPYGALSVALSVALPFIIYFFFVYESDFKTGGRRLMWAIFGVIFVSIWVLRLPETAGIMNWIYLFGIIAVILVIVFDNTIKKYFGWAKIKDWEDSARDARVANLQAEFERIRDVNSEPAARRREQIKKEVRRLIGRDTW